MSVKNFSYGTITGSVSLGAKKKKAKCEKNTQHTHFWKNWKKIRKTCVKWRCKIKKNETHIPLKARLDIVAPPRPTWTDWCDPPTWQSCQARTRMKGWSALHHCLPQLGGHPHQKKSATSCFEGKCQQSSHLVQSGSKWKTSYVGAIPSQNHTQWNVDKAMVWSGTEALGGQLRAMPRRTFSARLKQT